VKSQRFRVIKSSSKSPSSLSLSSAQGVHVGLCKALGVEDAGCCPRSGSCISFGTHTNSENLTAFWSVDVDETCGLPSDIIRCDTAQADGRLRTVQGIILPTFLEQKRLSLSTNKRQNPRDHKVNFTLNRSENLSLVT